MTGLDHPEGLDVRIVSNRARFDELLDRADQQLGRGSLEDGAALAQLAAALAWHSPTGLFASPRLESSLLAIARLGILGDSSSRRTPRGAVVQSVLHVLTTAYAIGGHTRLVRRWIENDQGRVHSIAVTRQGQQPLPLLLLEGVKLSGGEIHRIDRSSQRLLGRAAALQAMAAQADLVVLHTHPFDVVPSLALAALDESGRRPPTILLNHADHLFWIGLAASDLVVHLRGSGERLSVARRSLSPGRSAILPVPLSAPAEVEREQARRSLGYSETEVVAVSIASGYKFGAADGTGLLPILEAAVKRSPSLRILAVGPGERSAWKNAETRTNGRIRATGAQPDIAAIYASADIYLDSYPFSSLTSMLEAGQQRIPLVTYNDLPSEAEVLGFDDPATDGIVDRPGTPADYLETLEAYVGDPNRRSAGGRQIEAALAAQHLGPGWRQSLEQVYAQVMYVHESPRDRGDLASVDPRTTGPQDLDRLLVMLLDAQQADAPRGVRGHLRLAPLSIRLEEWRRSRATDRPLSILVLLPERALVLGRRASMLKGSLRRMVRLGGHRSTTDRGHPEGVA